MVTRPRSTATRHTYPFNQLSPDQFEEMVKLLASRDERFDPNSVEWIGGPGDKGRDVIAINIFTKKVWYIQAKRWQKFEPSNASAVINELVVNVKKREIEKPEAIIIAVSSRPTDKTRQKARQHARNKDINIVEFWDASELDDRISQNPLVRERFFHANLYSGPSASPYLGGFTKLPKIAALYDDGTQIERLAPGVDDVFPKLPDKLIERQNFLHELESSIGERNNLLLWSRLPKTTKTILAVQLAKRYSQENDIIYIRGKNSQRMMRQLLRYAERIRTESKATASLPFDPSYAFEDILALLIELLKRYPHPSTLIIDNFNEIESADLKRSLIDILSRWPHLAVIIVDNVTDRQQILGLAKDIKDIEISGYNIDDIFELLQLEELPSDAKTQKYAALIHAFCASGYPPLTHLMIQKVKELSREKGKVGMITPFLQKTVLPDDASIAITKALEETLTAQHEKTAIAVISLSLGRALPRRCITKVLEEIFKMQTPGEILQRLSNLWLDEDIKGRLSVPQALKLHTQSWLSDSKKQDIYNVFADQLCLLHKDDKKKPPLYIEADEWLDGISYLLFAKQGDKAAENWLPIVAYLGRNPKDIVIKQISNYPLLFIPANIDNGFTPEGAVLWEQSRSMIFTAAEKYENVIESMNNALEIISRIPANKKNLINKSICLINRGQANALMGKLKDAKADYLEAIKGFKNNNEEQKLSELIDIFCTTLLNPHHFSIDALPILIELIAECGVTNFYLKKAHTSASYSMRYLPDLILYSFENKKWHKKAARQVVEKLKVLSRESQSNGLYDLAIICLDAACFLLINKTDDFEEATKLYDLALSFKKGNIDRLTFSYLRAKCLVSYADVFYKQKREKLAHKNYIRALKEYHLLWLRDEFNELPLKKEYFIVHLRRRLAELNRQRDRIKLSERHLRESINKIGFGIRTNSLYFSYILPDLTNSIAMQGDSYQATRVLNLATLIGTTSPITLEKTKLCGWAALQTLDYNQDSKTWKLKITANAIGAVDLSHDLDELGKKMSPYWPGMAAYNLCTVWLPYNKNKAFKWFLRAESLRKKDKQYFWSLKIGLCFIIAINLRELNLALSLARLLFKEKWEAAPPQHKSDMKTQWTAYLRSVIQLANSFFASEENPHLALEIFDLASESVPRIISNSEERKAWLFEIEKAKNYFRYLHHI